MIDVHIHVAPPNLPGVGPLSPGFGRVSRTWPEWYGNKCTRPASRRRPRWAFGTPGRMILSGSIGRWRLPRECRDFTPSASPTRRKRIPNICGGPRLQIRSGQAVALKAYLGYLHHFANDPGYRPYYELAEKYKLPVFFHTGDTYSAFAKLKFRAIP